MTCIQMINIVTELQFFLRPTWSILSEPRVFLSLPRRRDDEEPNLIAALTHAAACGRSIVILGTHDGQCDHIFTRVPVPIESRSTMTFYVVRSDDCVMKFLKKATSNDVIILYFQLRGSPFDPLVKQCKKSRGTVIIVEYENAAARQSLKPLARLPAQCG